MSDNWDTSGRPAADDEDAIRRRQIEEMMRTDRPRYFRDELIQQEYRDIVDRQLERAESEANPTPAVRPGPFDEALARFKANRALAPDGQGDSADADRLAGKPVHVASTDMSFVPESPLPKSDNRSPSPRARIDGDEAISGRGGNDQQTDAKPERFHVAQNWRQDPALGSPQKTEAEREIDKLPNTKRVLEEVAGREGGNPLWPKLFVHRESGGDPKAITGSYKGLFQLSDKEFQALRKGGNILDPEDNAIAGIASLRGR